MNLRNNTITIVTNNASSEFNLDKIDNIRIDYNACDKKVHVVERETRRITLDTKAPATKAPATFGDLLKAAAGVNQPTAPAVVHPLGKPTAALTWQMLVDNGWTVEQIAKSEYKYLLPTQAKSSKPINNTGQEDLPQSQFREFMYDAACRIKSNASDGVLSDVFQSMIKMATDPVKIDFDHGRALEFHKWTNGPFGVKDGVGNTMHASQFDADHTMANGMNKYRDTLANKHRPLKMKDKLRDELHQEAIVMDKLRNSLSNKSKDFHRNNGNVIGEGVQVHRRGTTSSTSTARRAGVRTDFTRGPKMINTFETHELAELYLQYRRGVKASILAYRGGVKIPTIYNWMGMITRYIKNSPSKSRISSYAIAAGDYLKDLDLLSEFE